MSNDMPELMHSTGRTHRLTNARILPVAPTVIEGRTRNNPASAIVSTTSAMTTPISPDTPFFVMRSPEFPGSRPQTCGHQRLVVPASISSAVSAGGEWRTQRNEIDCDSQPYQNCANESKEHKLNWTNPEQTHNFHEQAQNNQDARHPKIQPYSNRAKFH